MGLSSFSILKWLSGFKIWQGDKLGKLLFNIVIIALCLWVFYAKFIAKDAPITNAEQIQNITQTRSHLLELELGAFKLGIL